MGKRRRSPSNALLAAAYPRVIERLFGAPIAIEPRKLKAIIAGLGPRMGIDVSSLRVELGPDMFEDDDEFSLDMEGDNRKGDNRKPYEMHGGTAVLEVYGSLVHRSSWMDAMSGLASYSDIGRSFKAAIADPDVSEVLLKIHSPGGECAGCFDLAETIYRARGSKPIYAIASDQATSAAYMLGCSADRFFATQSGVTGSIGVVMAHYDVTRADAMEGVKVTHIHAGARKVDGSPHKALDAESIASLQAEVDAFYELFVSLVARNRKLEAKVIEKTEAGIFIGKAGVAAGLVDEIASLDDVLSDLATRSKALAAFDRMGTGTNGSYALAETFSELLANETATGSDGPRMEDTLAAPVAQPSTEEVLMDPKTKGPEGATGVGVPTGAPSLQEQVDAMRAENARLKAEKALADAAIEAAADREKKAIIEKHADRGALTPAMHDATVELAKHVKPAELDALLSKYPEAIHRAGPVTPRTIDGAPQGGLTDEAKRLCRTLGLSEAAFTTYNDVETVSFDGTVVLKDGRRIKASDLKAGRG